MRFSTALVTGANGFLGRALIARLRGSGYRTLALVRRPADLGPDVQTACVDIRNSAAVHAALAGFRFDVAFHLAGAGVSPEDREPASMFDTNATATGTLVQACAHAGARAFVYAGSCAEYEVGEDKGTLDEDHRLTRSNLYGATKVAGGLWGTALARHCGITFCWLRLFGTFGPGEALHRLIPYVAARLLHNQTVDLTPGKQVRDLTYIDDVSEALILAGELAVRGHEGPCNLCSGLGTEVGDVACMVADVMRKPRELLRFGARPYRPDEPLWLVGDPSRFRQLTGFAPRIPLERGVAMSVEGLGYRR